MFRQWWVLATVGIVAAIGWSAFLTQIVAGEPFGQDPASDLTIWIVFILSGLILPAAAWWLRLETTVTARAIRLRFPPFRAREVPVDELRSFQLTSYRAVRGWGGYGYRRKLSGAVAFIVSGDRGVELETADGKELLIGSQRPEDLLSAIERARSA